MGSCGICPVFFFFFLFMDVPAAYGNLQARGRIRAAAEAYATVMATSDLSRICDLCCSLPQRLFLNPLREAGSQTCILMGNEVCWTLLPAL